ncbi:MAG TPA: alpha/beta hydrolase fold domain-containing protein [Chthoniobacterales bacterium]|nr:alpha/beta hydrolase fold domain-containing protein [Chthoniobacterales bacterium]
MNINRNPVEAADAAIIAEMRAANAENKRRVIGPEARSDSEAILSAEPPAPKNIRYERGLLGGVPGWWCRSGNALPGAGLLFFHGGGYVVGTAAEGRYLAAKLAEVSRAEAFVPDYRQAPESPFPAAVEDAMSVYQGLSAITEKIVLAGISAGGGLALALLEILANRDKRQRQPLAVAVLSPWSDLALTGKSLVSKDEADPFVTKPVLQHFADLYLQGADPTNPAASPLYGPVPATTLPLRIDVGDQEVLLDDSLRYAEKIANAGLSVSLNVWEGMPHGFQTIASLGAADASLKEIGSFLQGCLLRTQATGISEAISALTGL